MASKTKNIQDLQTVKTYLRDVTVREDDEVVEITRALILDMIRRAELMSPRKNLLRNEFLQMAWANEGQFNFQVHNLIPNKERQLSSTSRGVMGEDDLDIFKTSNESKPHINSAQTNSQREDWLKASIDEAWCEVHNCAISWFMFVKAHDEVTAELNGEHDDTRVNKGQLPYYFKIGKTVEEKANMARESGENYIAKTRRAA